MSRDLLLEIGVEEMPSAFMSRALADLKDIAARKFDEQRITCRSINTLGTPRRLVVHIQGLDE